MPYCSRVDLPMGRMPLPPTIDLTQKINSAAEEIDIALGSRYVTPFSLNETIPAQRPGALLLKRMNANIAAGRIIMEVTSPIENRDIHAYGARLVDDAYKELIRLRDEDRSSLIGAVPMEQNDNELPTNGPRIFNLDPVSRVDQFYETYAPADPLGLSLVSRASVTQKPWYTVIEGRQGQEGQQGTQGEPGIQGLPGDKGDKGDKGDQGVDVSARFVQGVASQTWDIPHTFARYPVVTIIGGNGFQVTPVAVEYPATDLVRVRFVVPTVGVAILT